MEKTSRKGSSDGSLRRARAARASVRAPFAERQRARREAARRRVVARTRTPLTPEQRAVDPIAHRVRTPGGRAGLVLLAVIGSIAVHLGAVGIGIALRANLGARTSREDVVIEMRQPPPPPPPPEQKPPPPPEPPAPVEKPVRPKVVAKVEPPPSTPQPPPKAPPVRVVGLSLESTSDEGGGPAFAVGNTRLGETEKKAIEPKDVTPPPSGTSTLPAAGTGRSNQVARHIPVDGITYTKAKRKVERKPPYPATLKSQGIEGDVPIMVTVDANGKVIKVKILKESPYPEFNEAARAHALSDEFEPATRDGVPMETTLSYTIRFRLEEGE